MYTLLLVGTMGLNMAVDFMDRRTVQRGDFYALTLWTMIVQFLLILPLIGLLKPMPPVAYIICAGVGAFSAFSRVSWYRAHLIEQWIIQSANYRAGGFTLDNALHLLAEEAGAIRTSVRRSFVEYKMLFPVWHPGWWETETGLSPQGAGVNLFDLLGNGDVVSAGQEKWPGFAALGPAHVSLTENGAWSLEALIHNAAGLLRR